MISGRIYFESSAIPVMRDGNRVLIEPGGWLDRFDSRFITLEHDDRTIWVGEAGDPFGSVPTSGLTGKDYTTVADCDGIKIRLLENGGSRSVSVSRTLTGSSPLYVVSDQEKLTLTWKFDEAASVLRNVKLDRESCLTFLRNGPSLTRVQILSGLYMLWPGESLVAGTEGISFTESARTAVVLPSHLLDDARVTDAFLDVITEALGGAVRHAHNPVIELSGGYDSSCVAIAAARAREGFLSYGLVHEGAVGEQQRNRRSELVKLLGLRDYPYSSFACGPFSALSEPECSLTPMDDNHRISCVRAIDSHPNGPIDLVLTGIGGDELAGHRSYIRSEWEVGGTLPSSSIVGSVGRADMFMRRGIWPLNPLSRPAVVDFCRQLPDEFRDKRVLHMLTLARAGLSDGFIFPRYSEHYGNMMQREASLIDFDRCLPESIVADFGLIDTSDLLSRARKASDGGFSYELIGELWMLFKLETVLRRYIM